MASSVSLIFTIIFLSSLDQGKLPDDLKTVYVAPYIKKEEKPKASNLVVLCLLLLYAVRPQSI